MCLLVGDVIMDLDFEALWQGRADSGAMAMCYFTQYN